MSDYADSGNLPRYFIPGLLFPTEPMFPFRLPFPVFRTESINHYRSCASAPESFRCCSVFPAFVLRGRLKAAKSGRRRRPKGQRAKETSDPAGRYKSLTQRTRRLLLLLPRLSVAPNVKDTYQARLLSELYSVADQ